MDNLLYILDEAAKGDSTKTFVLILLIILLVFFLLILLLTYSRINIKENECKIIKKRGTISAFTNTKIWVIPFFDNVLSTFKIKNVDKQIKFSVFLDLNNNSLLNLTIDTIYDVTDSLLYYKSKIKDNNNFDIEYCLKFKEAITKDSTKEQIYSLESNEDFMKKLNDYFSSLGITIKRFVVTNIEKTE